MPTPTEDERTAPPTPGSAEGERDAGEQSKGPPVGHTPGQAEGERDAPETEGQS